MDYKALEKGLGKRIRNRRLIEAGIFLASLFLSVAFMFIREATKKEVKVDSFILEHTYYEYNNVWVPFIVLFVIIYWIALVALIVDFIFIRYRSIEKSGYHITIYRGMLASSMYFNGNKVAEITFGQVLEAYLPNEIKVTASIYRGAFTLAHISFSDNTPSVEI